MDKARNPAELLTLIMYTGKTEVKRRHILLNHTVTLTVQATLKT